METKTNEMNKETKLVFNPGICRKLLAAGCTIVDIKADKTNKDKSVFAFKNDDAFKAIFSKINEEIAATKKSSETTSESENK